jgi:hypothetical protein
MVTHSPRSGGASATSVLEIPFNIRAPRSCVAPIDMMVTSVTRPSSRQVVHVL